jgi:3-oxoacyl-[acyl-carrier protein] reductase
MDQTAADLSFGDISTGDAFSLDRVFSQEDVAAFAGVSGDWSPLHVDPDYARATEFGGCVVHGMLLASLFSQLVGMRIPGKRALYLGQDLTFRRPVLAGERVRAIAKVSAKSEATRTLTLATEIRGADDRVAVSGVAKVKVRDAADGVEALAATPPASRAHREGKVALVTGGSRGIGAEIARELARRGCAVAINYFRSEARAAQLADEIAALGGTAMAVRADVRDPGDVARMMELVTGRLGTPSALVNGALGELEQTDATDLTWDRFLGQFEYQVKAVMQVCQSAYPLMRAAGGGAVVNLLSQVVAGAPPVRMADYVTAKHALEGLSKALAAEWAADGIRVNMVSPGLVQTELTQHYPERAFRMEAARTPLRRLAVPADVARAVAYLLSDDASFVTGTNLFVAGGQVM